MNVQLSPVEMFNELVRLGYVVPGTIEPSAHMVPTAYISVPTGLAFSTPPIDSQTREERVGNAKLGTRSKGNPKGNRRSKR